MLSAPEPVRTFSKLVMVSLPQPVFWAVRVARLTVVAVEPVKTRVSTPRPPSSVSLPSPPSMALALPSPVRMSAFALPIRFSMLRKVAIVPPAMEAAPSSAPFSVAVTPEALPAKDAVSVPSPPSSRSTTAPAFAPGLSVSSPAPPERIFALASPVRLSLKPEPARFSNPLSVSEPALTVLCAAPWRARLTVTPAAAPA